MAIFARHSDKEYDALAKKHETAESKLKAAEERVAALEAEQNELVQKAKSQADQFKKLEKSGAEQKEENDLLLAQLHQVQEELEKYFLENKAGAEKTSVLEKDVAAKQSEAKKAQDQATALGQQVEELKAKVAETEKKLSEANKLIKAEGDAKVNEVQKQKTELEKNVIAKQEELKKVQDQAAALGQQVEELKARVAETEKKLSEANKLIKAEGDAKVNEVQKQKTNLEKMLADAAASSAALKADLEKKLADAASEADRIKSELNALQIAETDLKSENDLLLAQLHQVQEELEKYYLNNKDLESLLATAGQDFRSARYALVNAIVNDRGFVVAPPAVALDQAAKASARKPVRRKRR